MAPTTGYAQNKYVRKNASKPEAADDLKALQDAMAEMRKRGCDDPTGWYYQGGIHWVPDDMHDHSNLGKGNPFCPSYLGKREQLKKAWDNCTHQGKPELHFLVWHRLYIYYLEDIVRTISKKKDFALPYWDYCDKQYRVLPAIYRNQNSSLFEKLRYVPLNGGQPIDEAWASTNLSLTALMRNRSYDLFCPNIDNAPHGAMHDYIGGGPSDNPAPVFNSIYQANTAGGLMGQVPSAAFDPIFWIHHANIDYIWQTWMNSPNGALPVLAELQKNPTDYVFFKPDGTAVQWTVAEAYKLAFSLPVTYQGLEEKKVVASKNQPESKEIKQVATQALQREITKNMTLSLNLKPKAELENLVKEKDARVILHIQVSFKEQPRGSFAVYVRNDGDKKLESAEQLVGVMNFFGAGHHGDHAAKEEKLTKEFRFDITDTIDVKKFDGKLDVLTTTNGELKATNQLRIEKVDLEVR
jgi:hypothetical protein